ncbi:hypothetical protein ZWY2020_035296 [Hordeum vulgare]|nr:hypothetical protein ZWY2020_035296 [Hordeum vulgare]
MPRPQPPSPSSSRGEEEEFVLLASNRSNFNEVIMVIDSSSNRYLVLDPSRNVHSILPKKSAWTNSYWDEFVSLPPVVPRGPVALLGLGAGTAAHMMLEVWPWIQLIGWEIDPTIIELSRDYFGMSNLEKTTELGGSLSVRIGDALSPSATVEGGFAGIVVDLFADGKVLPQLQEAETWLEIAKKLMPDGRIMVNHVEQIPLEAQVYPAGSSNAGHHAANLLPAPPPLPPPPSQGPAAPPTARLPCRLRCVPDEIAAKQQQGEEEEEEEELVLLASYRTDFNEVIMVIDSPSNRYLVLDPTRNVHSILPKKSAWTNSYWAETWLGIAKKLMPDGRIMVNCGGADTAVSLAADTGVSSWVQNPTIKALCSAFPGKLNWKRLSEKESVNYVALTGPLPDLEEWSTSVPSELSTRVKQWVPCDCELG